MRRGYYKKGEFDIISKDTRSFIPFTPSSLVSVSSYMIQYVQGRAIAHILHARSKQMNSFLKFASFGISLSATDQSAFLINWPRLLLEYYDATTSKFDSKILIYIVVIGFVQVKENLESHGIQAFHFSGLESHGI